MDLLNDAMYGNCPLDADEPPTTRDQSAEPSNFISFDSKFGSSGACAGNAARRVYVKQVQLVLFWS